VDVDSGELSPFKTLLISVGDLPVLSGDRKITLAVCRNRSHLNDTVDDRKVRTRLPRTCTAGFMARCNDWHFVAE
jgi:hypothetical protein